MKLFKNLLLFVLFATVFNSCEPEGLDDVQNEILEAAEVQAHDDDNHLPIRRNDVEEDEDKGKDSKDGVKGSN